MKSFLARHPKLLLSVSPLLDGYLTVAAGFLIAHVFLSASSFLTFVFAGGFMAGTFLRSLLIGRFADQYGQSFFLSNTARCSGTRSRGRLLHGQPHRRHNVSMPHRPIYRGRSTGVAGNRHGTFYAGNSFKTSLVFDARMVCRCPDSDCDRMSASFNRQA